jgi:DHA2 family multidrug resistance protein
MQTEIDELDSPPENGLSNKQLIGFMAMSVGMFMAILDIQIVASSLGPLQQGLNTTPGEIVWVQTSYLIAEVIVIPLTGYLTKLLSTRILFSIAAAGFTLLSLLCALASGIDVMIVFRFLQGIFGGVMIPSVFATGFSIFPKSQIPKVSVVIGLLATSAPTLGPIIGGYLTERFSWEFIFLLNIIPGVIITLIIFFLVDFDRPNPNLAYNFDLFGLICLVIFLGCLQYVLENGSFEGWFASTKIIYLTSISAIAGILLIYNELTANNPILDLTAFRDLNFTLGCIFSFIIGFAIFSSVYMIPFFLNYVAEMNAWNIGITMMVFGGFQFLSAPIAGGLYNLNIDGRIILAAGVLMFSLGSYLNSFLTIESGYYMLFLPQAIRGLALMFCFIPINDIALGTIASTKLQNASGLYNLMRNLGGAVGLALINTYLVNHIKKASIIFSSQLNIDNLLQQESLMELFSNLFLNYSTESLTGMHSFMSEFIYKESIVVTVNNIFICLSVFFMIILVLIPFTHKTQNQN